MTRFDICLLALILSTATAVFANSDNSAPVLIDFKSSAAQLTNTVLVGSQLSAADLLNKIGAHLEQHAAVDLIVVNDQVRDQDLRHALKTQPHLVSENVHYEPSVIDAYQALVDFLAATSSVKVNLFQEFDNVHDALQFFMQRHSSAHSTNPIILTGASEASRSKRSVENHADATYSNLGKGPVNYLLGDECVARFESLSLVEIDRKLRTKETYGLDYDALNSKLECINDTSVLTVSFTSNHTLVRNLTDITLNFVKTEKGSWRLTKNNATSNVDFWSYQGQPDLMETYFMFSYACSKSSFLYNVANQTDDIDSILIIENFQFQAFGLNTSDVESNRTISFGHINYCQGFFTQGIIVMVVITLIFVVLVTCSMSFITNIQTVDRFEDPKKTKPLPIAIKE